MASQSESNQSFIFSPRFKSVAAMAGWDEETLLSASLIVDDTPDRELAQKKRVVLSCKTPPSTDSRKKRRVQRSPVPIVSLDLDDAGATKNDTKKDVKEEKKGTKGDILTEENASVSCSGSSLPCMDKLREELSCAICLDICFEPSTTPCGHSFCLKCLQSAASKCGKKCPKCRQLIRNGRSCTVNTVLWNTIQLLFPQEVEAKKEAVSVALNNSREKIKESAFYDNLRNTTEIPQRDETTTAATTSSRRRATRSQNEDNNPLASLEREIRGNIRASRASSRLTPVQDEDAAIALRLQREEFMGVVRADTNTTTTRLNRFSDAIYSETTTHDQSITSGRSSSFSSARENLRAMASRATRHVRGWNF